MIAVVIAGIAGSGSVGTAVQPDRAGAVPPRAASVPKCPSVQKALRFYTKRWQHWTQLRGAGFARDAGPTRSSAGPCPRYLLTIRKRKAAQARAEWNRYFHYHYAWSEWLPDKWQRIGACETGYGRRPGNWRHNSGTYQGAFGFAVSSWDSFVGRADPRARPYPSEAYQATPRQQYEVALAIYRMFGFSGWGCRGA